MRLLCLCDNDVILKLAALDLLVDSFSALKVQQSNVRVLPTAKYVLKRPAAKLGKDVSGRLKEFLEKVRVIDWELPPAEILLFEDTLGIDAGESVLFASTANAGDFILTTGDKVCLKALASSSECEKILNRLAERVVCLEQIVKLCIARHGFEVVKSRIVIARDCDKSLATIFGSGLNSTPDSVAEGLDSYIRNLRSTTGILLSPH